MANSNDINTANRRMRYTRQSIVTSTFLQMPRFLTAGEFAGNGISNNARFLYTLLLDRHRVSVKNGWFDENGEVYIYFKREEMETQLGVSERTVSKVMQELKDIALVEEKKQGLNKPNKIYLLIPVFGDGESADPYLDPAPDHNPEDAHDCISENWHGESCNNGYIADPAITSSPDTQNIRVQTHKTYVPEPVNFTAQDPQNLSPNYNKFSNNNMSDNELSETTATACAMSDAPTPTAAAAEPQPQNRASPPIPYLQIVEMFNQLCKATGLRPIQSIKGKRKTQTAARFKEYELSGFF